MRFLASIKVRIFIISWIFFTIHFATDVVREHYPAFSLVENGTFKVDKYQGFHPDIFVHTDGHSYIGNNVTASVIAAVPLFFFDPILDAIERYEVRKIRREGVPETQFRSDRPNSVKLMKKVKERGLSLRFGAATVVTSVFLMAPLSALTIVLMFHLLSKRDLPTRKALWLSLLFGFGTPVFFRTAILNHNMLIMYIVFFVFYLLWILPGMNFPVSLKKRMGAGFLCGLCLALDYSGVIPLLVFFGYLIVRRLSTASLKVSISESIPFVLGSILPVLFLLYSQWAMFGNAFLPGQYWMPDITNDSEWYYHNPYSESGFRGFTMPKLDLFFLNLFSSSYGIYTYGPILAIGLIPTFFYKRTELILPRPERILVFTYFLLFLTFCSANQYSRLQFNSGFRYLLPLLPLIYLSVCDHLVRLPRLLLIIIVVPILFHSWVISMVRLPYEVPSKWHLFINEGFQLPWLKVFISTKPESHPVFCSSLLPIAIIILTLFVIFFIWKIGECQALKLRKDSR